MAMAMNTRPPMCIRTNTLKVTRQDLIGRLAEEAVTAVPTRLSPLGLVLETRVNAFGLSAFRDGLFEVMDEGSQLVAEVVAPPPRSRVVDAWAGEHRQKKRPFASTRKNADSAPSVNYSHLHPKPGRTIPYTQESLTCATCADTVGFFADA
jgi:hypothetical protein